MARESSNSMVNKNNLAPAPRSVILRRLGVMAVNSAVGASGAAVLVGSRLAIVGYGNAAVAVTAAGAVIGGVAGGQLEVGETREKPQVPTALELAIPMGRNVALRAGSALNFVRENTALAGKWVASKFSRVRDNFRARFGSRGLAAAEGLGQAAAISTIPTEAPIVSRVEQGPYFSKGNPVTYVPAEEYFTDISDRVTGFRPGTFVAVGEGGRIALNQPDDPYSGVKFFDQQLEGKGAALALPAAKI